MYYDELITIYSKIHDVTLHNRYIPKNPTDRGGRLGPVQQDEGPDLRNLMVFIILFKLLTTETKTILFIILIESLLVIVYLKEIYL